MTKWLSLNFYDINCEAVADMLYSDMFFHGTEGQC